MLALRGIINNCSSLRYFGNADWGWDIALGIIQRRDDCSMARRGRPPSFTSSASCRMDPGDGAPLAACDGSFREVNGLEDRCFLIRGEVQLHANLSLGGCEVSVNKGMLLPSSSLYRYVMFAAELAEELSRWPGAAICYVVKALSNTLNSIGARCDVELALISLYVLVWQTLFHAPKLPRRRFGKSAMYIGKRRWELCSAQNARANLLDEIDMRQEGAARIGMRVENAHLLSELLPHDFDGL